MRSVVLYMHRMLQGIEQCLQIMHKLKRLPDGTVFSCCRGIQDIANCQCDNNESGKKHCMLTAMVLLASNNSMG